MKKRVLAIILAAMLAALTAGCGKTEEPAASTATTEASQAVESESAPASQESTPVEVRDESSAHYEAFLKNEEKVYTDRFEKWYAQYYDTDYCPYERESYTLEELLSEMYENVHADSENCELKQVEYAYLDCADDGVEELALRVSLDNDWTEFVYEPVIKYIDNKLQLTAQLVSDYRDEETIANYYGRTAGACSYTYYQWTNTTGYLDAEGRYNQCYSNDVSLYAFISLDSRFEQAVLESDEDVADAYIRVITLDRYDYDSEAYQANVMYCAEKEADEESNGIDFKENVRIMQSVFDAAGVKLYSLDEVHEAIAKREKELKVTDNMKNGTALTWKAYSLPESWQFTGSDAEEDPLGIAVTLPYSADAAFDPAQYPDLAAKGDITDQEYENMVESFSDMLSNTFISDFFSYHYSDSVVQQYCEDGDTRIVSVDVQGDNALLGEIAKKVGYSDYYATYYYTYGIWRDYSEQVNAPVCCELFVDDNYFVYWFANNQLAARIKGEEEGSLNPKTNDFINSIYKLGCYYGSVFDGRKGAYTLYMTDNDQVKNIGKSFVITAQIQGLDNEYELILDENTVWGSGRENFTGYEQGETPFEWAQKVSGDPEEYNTAFAGLFDVVVTGDHIDELVACYWWD